VPRFHERVMGVYFDDLDPFHILHNARYLLLFERTLGSLWEEMGFGALQGSAQAMHLVRANSIEYHAPVRGTGQVRVRVWIARLGRSSLTFGFTVMPVDQDLAAASGERVVVHVDPETWRPTPWGREFRERIGPWVHEEAP
jgi:acyl-CoA thioester hydrolase